MYTAAIIGTGRIAREHVDYYRHRDDVQVQAASNRSTERLQKFITTHAIDQSYQNHLEMLEKVQPDIVSICTYVNSHRQLIEDCSAYGVKGIICEKPFLAQPEDIAAIRKLVAETNIKIIVPHMRRYLSVFAEAKRLYCSGSIGEPVMCLAGMPRWDILDGGSHWLDMFRFFHDDQPAQWVMAQMQMEKQVEFEHPVEEHGMLSCCFENGGRGYLESRASLNSPHSMTLVGSEGTVRIGGENMLTINGKNHKWAEKDYELIMPAEWDADRFYYEGTNAWVAMWDVLFDSLILWLEGGSEPMCGAQNMLLTAELNLAACTSAQNGKKMYLPVPR